MIRDITIGQYYPADSVLHKLDPRTKLICTFLYIVSLFISANFISYGLVMIFLATMIIISKVPAKFIFKGLKTIFIIIIFTVTFNLFLTPGDTLWWTFWRFNIYKEGVIVASLMASRLVFLIVGSSLLTLTTSPITLTDGIEYLLKPLERVRVPAHEIAMMMTIALRFIPILLEETDKIMKAQMARGADFESGGIFKKAKAMLPLLVPLFISAFRRADDLALAMEARCYRGGEGRTRMNQLRYYRRDLWSYLVFAAYIAALIILKILLGQ